MCRWGREFGGGVAYHLKLDGKPSRSMSKRLGCQALRRSDEPTTCRWLSG